MYPFTFRKLTESGTLLDNTIFGNQNIGLYLLTFLVTIATIAAIWGFVSSKNWAPLSGRINHIEMLEIHNPTLYSSSSGKPFTEYKIDIEFTYQFSGKAYTGNKIYPIVPNIFTSKTYAEELMRKFKQGQTTTVYVSQNAPEVSCLISSRGISNIRLIMFALIAFTLLSVTIYGIVYFNRIFSS